MVSTGDAGPRARRFAPPLTGTPAAPRHPSRPPSIHPSLKAESTAEARLTNPSIPTPCPTDNQFCRIPLLTTGGHSSCLTFGEGFIRNFANENPLPYSFTGFCQNRKNINKNTCTRFSRCWPLWPFCLYCSSQAVQAVRRRSLKARLSSLIPMEMY